MARRLPSGRRGSSSAAWASYCRRTPDNELITTTKPSAAAAAGDEKRNGKPKGPPGIPGAKATATAVADVRKLGGQGGRGHQRRTRPGKIGHPEHLEGPQGGKDEKTSNLTARASKRRLRRGFGPCAGLGGSEEIAIGRARSGRTAPPAEALHGQNQGEHAKRVESMRSTANGRPASCRTWSQWDGRERHAIRCRR